MTFKLLLASLILVTLGCSPKNRNRPARYQSKEFTTTTPDSADQKEPHESSSPQISPNAETQKPAASTQPQTPNSGTPSTPKESNTQNETDTSSALPVVDQNTLSSAKPNLNTNTSESNSNTTQQAPSTKQDIKINSTVTQGAPSASSNDPAQSQTSNSNTQNENDPLNTKVAAEGVRNKLDQQAQAAETHTGESAETPEQKKWLALVEYIAEKGESSESPMGFYVSLTDASSTNPDEARILSYISIVGGATKDSKGQFHFSRVEAVWEDWKINAEGNKDGDQWLFLLSRDGNIAKYWRYHLVKKLDDTVLVHQGLDITDEEAKTKWLEVREKWYQKMPQNP